MPDPVLTPQVKGRLAQQERAILDLLAAGTGDTFRTSVSLDPALALAAVRAADADNRDFSNFVSVALREHCGQFAAPTGALAEFIGELTAAATANPLVLDALKRTLRDRVRRARAA